MYLNSLSETNKDQGTSNLVIWQIEMQRNGWVIVYINSTQRGSRYIKFNGVIINDITQWPNNLLLKTFEFFYCAANTIPLPI